jgi:hypothetical protein
MAQFYLNFCNKTNIRGNFFSQIRVQRSKYYTVILYNGYFSILLHYRTLERKFTIFTDSQFRY